MSREEEEEEEEEAIRALKQREREGGEKDTQPRFYGTAAAVSETRNDPRPKPTTFLEENVLCGRREKRADVGDTGLFLTVSPLPWQCT